MSTQTIQYKKDSPEYRSLKELNLYSSYARKFHTAKRKFEFPLYITNVSTRSIRSELSKKIIAETDIVPCEFTDKMFEDGKYPKDRAYKRYIKFLQTHSAEINATANLIRMYLWKQNGGNELSAEEEVRKIIGGLNLDIKKSPMKKIEVKRAMIPLLLNVPQMLTWDEILEIHERDVRGDKAIPVKIPENVPASIDPLPISQLDNTRKQFVNKSPWKTFKKMELYGNRQGWDTNTLTSQFIKESADSFDMTEQRKIMKHYYGPRYTFIIDYMYAGRFYYLLAINMNTRKAFAILSAVHKQYGTRQYYVPSTFNPDATHSIKEMQKLLALTPVKYIIMDQQASWKSNEFHQFLESRGIKYRHVEKYDVKDTDFETVDAKRSVHSTSIIDRLIRTLRMMNFNLGNDKEIEPAVMEFLIDEYNNSPHGTLSKIFKQNITPNDVDSDIRLETELCRHIARQNFVVESNPDYEINGLVRVYNDANRFDKVKPKLLPGKWKFVERIDGLFKLKKGDVEIMVPRWMIKL